MAALTSLPMAREWFEQRFTEVHVYSPETHPLSIAANRCPNGALYMTVVNGEIVPEGTGRIPPIGLAADWFGCLCHLWEASGRPSFLWWRVVPEIDESGRIYSRLAMTHSGAYQSYRGKPLERAA